MESLLPFLQGTCTPYNMPVYPGAQRIIANSRFQPPLFRKRGLACMQQPRVVHFDLTSSIRSVSRPDSHSTGSRKRKVQRFGAIAYLKEKVFMS